MRYAKRALTTADQLALLIDDEAKATRQLSNSAFLPLIQVLGIEPFELANVLAPSGRQLLVRLGVLNEHGQRRLAHMHGRLGHRAGGVGPSPAEAHAGTPAIISALEALTPEEQPEARRRREHNRQPAAECTR